MAAILSWPQCVKELMGSVVTVNDELCMCNSVNQKQIIGVHSKLARSNIWDEH